MPMCKPWHASMQAGGSNAALAALSDQLVRAGYLPANGGSSSALQLQVRARRPWPPPSGVCSVSRKALGVL